MRRRSLVAGAATFALLSTSLLAAPPATSSDGFDPSVFAKKSDRTPFAYKSATYGSRVRGGEIPASSGTTSYQAIGCTNVAGVDKTNVVASVEIPGLGVAKGVSTRNWTERSNGVHSSYATHDITKIVLSESELRRARDQGPELVLPGLPRRVRVPRDHQDRGGEPDLHPDRRCAAGACDPDAWFAGRSFPGSWRSGSAARRRGWTATAPRPVADVLDVTLLPTDTLVRVAHTGAKLNRGVKRGLFAGFSAATQVRALDDLVQSGPQPHTRMPCQGTYGQGARARTSPRSTCSRSSRWAPRRPGSSGSSAPARPTATSSLASRASTSVTARWSSRASVVRPTSCARVTASRPTRTGPGSSARPPTGRSTRSLSSTASRSPAW